MKGDIISIVEAAYDLESDDRAWLSRLLEQAAPRLDRGFGVTIQTYVPGMRFDESVVNVWQINPRVIEAMRALAGAHRDLYETINTPRGREHMETATEKLGLNPAEAARWNSFRTRP
jgi:hypothetical protein